MSTQIGTNSLDAKQMVLPKHYDTCHQKLIQNDQPLIQTTTKISAGCSTLRLLPSIRLIFFRKYRHRSSTSTPDSRQSFWVIKSSNSSPCSHPLSKHWVTSISPFSLRQVKFMLSCTRCSSRRLLNQMSWST